MFTQSSLALAFPSTPEPSVLSAARALAARIETGQRIDRQSLNRILTEHFGGSDAEGRWTVRDAHAALELAQVIWLKDHSVLTPSAEPGVARAAFDRLDELLPAQHVRSEEQIELQQFATPPRLAWLAARACNLRAGDRLLEPSAGTGMLALWAQKMGARLALNELSPPRRECLGAVFPDAAVSGHDAELIDDLLAAEFAPNVVLMNPPYSVGVERGSDGKTGARHARAALRRLTPGGRLVAIMPEWFDLARFRASVPEPIAVRLNAAIERAFVRHGTSITTRLIVLDKSEGGDLPATLKPVNLEELGFLVGLMTDRREPWALRTFASRSVLPLRAVAQTRKPIPSRLGPLRWRLRSCRSLISRSKLRRR